MTSGITPTALGELVDLIMGQAPSSKDCNLDRHGTPFVKVGEFGEIRPVIREWTTNPLRMARRSDVLLCVVGATCGKINLGEECAIGRSVAAIRPHVSELDQYYLYYFMMTLVERLRSGSVGAAQTVISKEMVETVQFPLVPLSEQQRIVGILDEAFDGIATATANAKKNLQNARALFQSHLQSVFTQRGKGWDRVTLETLLERGWIESHLDGNHGEDYPRKEEFIAEGVPYISAKCLSDERVDMSRSKYLSHSRATQLRKGIAKDNDVLFAHNATVGPVAILHTDEEKIILGTSLTYYRCNPKHILPEYLAHYMRSFAFKTQYLQVMRQSTRNQVPITKQREFYHVIPPLDEQKSIIGALDGLFENGQRLQSIYQRKLAALEALKKSLLDQAFTGEL